MSKFSIGTHKISVGADKTVSLTKKDSSIKINKVKTNVKLSKSSFGYKKQDTLKITITDKNTKKVLSNVKISLKVYNGKKVLNYILKTDKNGMVKISTKNLSKGNHKIVVSSVNKYYSLSKNISIKVK